MQREPYIIITRQAKTLPSEEQDYSDFFLREVGFRDRFGVPSMAGRPTVEACYEKILRRQAENIWNMAARLKINPVNLAFIFLNRYYAMSVQEKSIPKMHCFWDDFQINISHEYFLVSLLNYDEEKRALIYTLIKEIQEVKDSTAFLKFMTTHVKGYKVSFPQHDRGRSRMFEHILVMLKQIEESKHDYFLKNHMIEVIKAHVWGLQQHGNPIILYLGNFIGDTAMYRLRVYHDWIKKTGRSTSGNGLHGLQGSTF